MSNSHPKLMLKVELLSGFDVKVTLLQMSHFYANTIDGSKFYFTNNNWTIYQGTNFCITSKNVMSLPISCLRQSTKVFFKTEQQRYMFMKEFARALDNWSKSHIFAKHHSTTQTKINFHKSIWVIF